MHHPNNHNDNAMVAILHTRTCRGRGMSASIAAIKPNGGRVRYDIGTNRSASEEPEEVPGAEYLMIPTEILHLYPSATGTPIIIV